MSTTIPGHYRRYASVSLSTQKGLLLGLTVASTVLLLLCGWAFIQAVRRLRPDAAGWLALVTFTQSDGAFSAGISGAYLIGAIIATPLVVVLHEAVHGVMFWAFTRERPVFAFKIWYAYAAAPPGVYVPRNPYLVVALAPLVVLTVLGLLLALVLPPVALPTLVCFLTLNAAGAVGDMFVVIWLLRYPATTLVEDVGDTMTAYGPP